MYIFRINIQYIDMQKEVNDTDFLNKLNKFEEKNKALINLILKPVLTLTVFLAVGYYTLWMSTSYVKQDKFSAYIDKQIASDKEKDDVFKTRFDLTQNKLETIINQQSIFTEQLKTYNALIISHQKQIDSFGERLLFVERK
jgi:hypothetical protein